PTIGRAPPMQAAPRRRASVTEARSRWKSRSLARAWGVALDGEVLVGPPEVDILLAGGMARPVRIVEVTAGEHAQVGPAGGEDRVGVRVGGEVTNRHRRDVGLVSDSVAEGRLVEPPVDGLLVRHGLAGRHGDRIAAVRPKPPRDAD